MRSGTAAFGLVLLLFAASLPPLAALNVCAVYRRATAWRGRPGTAGHAWFIGSGWQQRSRKLYALAGEVAQLVEQQ